MSRTAFSVAAFSMRAQPSSRLSAVTTWMVCSRTWASTGLGCCCSSWRSWLARLTRSGSLHVTMARDPTRLHTIRCAARHIRFSSGSIAKSLRMSSRVVMHAMVTLRSTTGEMISRMARSTATGTRRLSCSRSATIPRDGLTWTYACRLRLGSAPASCRPLRAAATCAGRAPGAPAAALSSSPSAPGRPMLSIPASAAFSLAAAACEAACAACAAAASALCLMSGLLLWSRGWSRRVLVGLMVPLWISIPRCLKSTSISNLRLSFTSSSLKISTMRLRIGISHGLGGLKILEFLHGSSTLATNGTTAIMRPRSKAS
mmetsp:Transcript_31855/g.101477  ORF Transcript_31855/g.101477 Transcript_31855/m.101477 type:complete len:316 (-) Transcript_31855:479-1426(-)